MNIKFRREKKPTDRDRRKEWLISEMKNIEEYMKSLAPMSDEYDAYRDNWLVYNKELMALEEDENKKKFRIQDLLPWATLLVTAGGTVATVATSLHKDKTKEKLGELAYQKEEVDNELGNGRVYSLATKD
jgi:hypothetical protein